jgi:hypothetical protein
MKNILKISCLFALLAFFTACETTELDELLENPNTIGERDADANFILNNIQLAFNGITNGLRGSSMNITRMTAQFGQYSGAVTNNTLVGAWTSSYNLFANVDLLEEISNNSEAGLPYHIGVAQVIEAYTYITLIDYVGDVPFTQANQFSEFPTPIADDDEFVYMAQIDLLNTAIANLNAESVIIPQDLYFTSSEAFDPSNWITIANTLKLKAYLNMGNGAAITNLLSEDIIDTAAEDFQFNYSTATAPESRSPIFLGNYPDGAGFYMSNAFYDYLNAGDSDAPFMETGIADPRLRYYIYRQRNGAPSGDNLPCTGNPAYEYCYVGNLYWGRDHGDDEGIPNDNTRRSTWGVYPSGGAFDRDQFTRTDSNNIETLNGAGINPIFLSSYTHFALAEAGLDLGVSVDSRTLLMQGIQLSMDKVTASSGELQTDNGEDEFLSDGSPNPDYINFAPSTTDISDYISRVMDEYDAASGNEAKLAVVIREWYLASWGNGIEPYNMYRRTGYPTLQTGIIPVGPFPRTYRYPTTEVETNPNISQTTADNQVFWDTNPAGFIN